jgi:hypothetical protein
MQGSIQHVKSILTELEAYGTLVAAATHTVTVDNYTTDIITAANAAGDVLRIDPRIAEDNYTVDDYTTDIITAANAAGNPLFIDAGIAEDNYTVNAYNQNDLAIVDVVPGVYEPLFACCEPLVLPFATAPIVCANDSDDALFIDDTLAPHGVAGYWGTLNGILTGAANAYGSIDGAAGAETVLVVHQLAGTGYPIFVKGGVLVADLTALGVPYLFFHTNYGRAFRVLHDVAPGAVPFTLDSVAAISFDFTAGGNIISEGNFHWVDRQRTITPPPGEAIACAHCIAAGLNTLVGLTGAVNLQIINNEGGGINRQVYVRVADLEVVINSPVVHSLVLRTTGGSFLPLVHDGAAPVTGAGVGYVPVFADDALMRLTADMTGAGVAGNVPWETLAATHGQSPSAVIADAQAGGGDGIVTGVLNGTLTGAVDDEIDIGGGVFVAVKHRAAPTGYAIFMNATLDGLECNNTATGSDLFFRDSLGKLYRVVHNGAPGIVPFTAEAAGPPTTFQATGGAVVTSEPALHALAPKTTIAQAQTGGGDGITIGVLNGTLTGAVDDEINIGGGVFVAVKHRDVPTGYAVMMNAGLTGLECNNTATGTDLYFKDSAGRLYKVTHNAGVGIVPFTAEAAAPPTVFQATGGATITSEAALHSLAPKAALTVSLGHPAIP